MLGCDPKGIMENPKESWVDWVCRQFSWSSTTSILFVIPFEASSRELPELNWNIPLQGGSCDALYGTFKEFVK